MLIQYSSRSIALKSGLLALAILVFLGGLGTRLSVYQDNQNNAAMVKVRLGVEKQPDLTPVHCSHLRLTQEDLGFSVSSNCWQQETPGGVDAAEATERMEQIVPTRPAYNPHLPQLAYRPPPIHS